VERRKVIIFDENDEEVSRALSLPFEIKLGPTVAGTPRDDSPLSDEALVDLLSACEKTMRSDGATIGFFIEFSAMSLGILPSLVLEIQKARASSRSKA
jgi:hypothetical protein